MKTSLLSLTASAICVMACSAQVSTTPVGYISLGDTSGGDAIPANTDMRISLPLFNSTEAVATIATSGISGNDLTIDGAAYTVDQFSGYYAVVSSGTNEGQLLLVNSNTATTLTVSTTSPGDSLTGLADGDTLNLSEAWTIGSAIGDVPVGTQLFAFSGSADGINLAPDVTYAFGEPFAGFFGGVNQWYNSITLQAAANSILYPGEALVIRTGATPIADLVIAGSVSTTASRNIILGGAAAQDTPLAFISPVGEPVILADIPATPGDQILIYDQTQSGINLAPSTIYAYGEPFAGFFGGVNKWYNSITLAALTTEVLPAGASYVFRTAGASSDVAWSSAPEFTNP